MNSFRIFFSTFVFVLASIVIPVKVEAQCAMCKRTVESTIEGEGKVVGKGLNNGILYLMTVPYLVLGGIGFMVYRNWKGGRQA
jgi:hypothetical protein